MGSIYKRGRTWWLKYFMAAEVNRLRFGLDRLARIDLGTPLVQPADPEKGEAGTPSVSRGIPAWLLAGCRGLEPLSSGVTVGPGKLAGGSQVSQPHGIPGCAAGPDGSDSPGFAAVPPPFGIPLVSKGGASTRPVPQHYLTVREVAKLLNVATSTVYKLCAEGKLAHVRVSNAIRVHPTAVGAWLASTL